MRTIVVIAAFVIAIQLPSQALAQLATAQQRRVDEAVPSASDAAVLVERFEKSGAMETRKLAPMGELYVQRLKSDGSPNGETAIGDFHRWGRFRTLSALTRVPAPLRSSAARTDRLPEGLEDLLSPDFSFDARKYRLTFVRRELLDDDALVWVFDVHPLDIRDGFTGRLYLDQRGTVLRYLGNRRRVDEVLSNLLGLRRQSRFVYAGWRVRIHEELFLTTDVFVQETSGSDSDSPALARGQLRVWNYQRVEGEDWRTRLRVDPPAVTVTAKPSTADDQRRWNREIEDYILELLTRDGYLAPEGTFETKLCGQVIANLLVPSDLIDHIDPPIRCRVLLTSRLDLRTIGNTGIISIGMLDTAPDEATVGVMVAHIVAHIALSHPLIDPKVALSERSPRELIDLLDQKPHNENETAEKAVELLDKSLYASKLEKAGLFIDAIADVTARLPALAARNVFEHIGDASGTMRRSRWMRHRPVYDPKREGHYSALPLGSRLTLDRVTNRVELLGAPLLPVLGKSFGIIPRYPESATKSSY